MEEETKTTKIKEFKGFNEKTVDFLQNILKDQNIPPEAAADLNLLLLKTAQINEQAKKKQDKEDLITRKKQDRKAKKEARELKRENNWKIIQDAVYISKREPETEQSIKKSTERFVSLSIGEKRRLKIFFNLSLYYLKFEMENSKHGFKHSLSNNFKLLLNKAGIKTIGTLAACNETELRELKGVGKISINECRFIFKELGLDFDAITPTFVDLCMGFDMEEKPEIESLTISDLLLAPYADRKMLYFLRENFNSKDPLKLLLSKTKDNLRYLDSYFLLFERHLYGTFNSLGLKWDSYPIAKGALKPLEYHPFY